jgi:glutathione peroxidase-family protein
MLRITRDEFNRFVKYNNPEVFTENQINSWVMNMSETLQKAETDELNDIEKSEVQQFNDEFSSFMCIEVVGRSEDILQKGLQYDRYYVREQQIEWDPIEKSGKANIGDIHIWNGKKFKKQVNGKWVEVSESHGMTKKEHEFQSDVKKEAASLAAKDKKYFIRDTKLESGKLHSEQASKLSDKEYSDEEVEINKSLDNDIEKAKSGVYKDTALNRKMNRVGVRFGSQKKEEKSEKNVDPIDKK